MDILFMALTAVFVLGLFGLIEVLGRLKGGVK
jgi:hypothetical protein